MPYVKKRMPKKYTKKRRVYGRTKRKNLKWNSMRTNVTRIRQITRSDKLRVRLPYEELVSIGGATSGSYIFNINSLFDPNRTGVGHQPMGFDQYATMYNRYIVHGVKYTVECVNNSGTAVTVVGLIANNDATALTPSVALEQSRGKNDVLTINTSSKAMKTYSGYLACSSIAGVSKQKYNSDDAYQAVTTASPTESILMHIFCQDFGLSTNVNMLFRVRLLYYATFYDPNNFAQS